MTISEYTVAVGVFRAYISPIIAILGLIGNCFIIIIFAKEKPRTRFSIYAISLAVAQTVCLVVNTLMDDFFGRGLAYATNHRFQIKFDMRNNFACKVMEYIPNAMYFVSSYIIVVFSFDRMLTIYNPMRFYSLYHKRYAAAACSIVFAVGILSNISTLQVQTIMHDPQHRSNFTCQMDRNQIGLAEFCLFFFTLFTFVIPVIIIIILNILILAQLWKVYNRRRLLVPTDTGRSAQEMARVLGHLALSSSFLLLYLPLAVAILVRLHICEINRELHTSRANRIIDITRFLSSLKDITYATNFLLYYIFLQNFRNRFANLFHKSYKSVPTSSNTQRIKHTDM